MAGTGREDRRMGLMARIGFWRKVGRVLNTTAGARMMAASRGLLNLSTRLLPGPRIDGPPPFVRPQKALPDCTVAVITTSGLHVEGDRPFDVDDPKGDPSFRTIPSDVDPGALRIAHAHYTHRWWEQDREVLLPFERLRELEAAGVFRLAPRFFSFGFGGLRVREYIDPKGGTAHEVAARLREDGVDFALLVPA